MSSPYRSRLSPARVPWVLLVPLALGGAVLVRVSLSYRQDQVALGVCFLMALTFLLGLGELAVRRARAALQIKALRQVRSLQDLEGRDPRLAFHVRARLFRQPYQEPAAFAGTLVGLLVMLGLLGTFFGLV